jgi:hypothetical protein
LIAKGLRALLIADAGVTALVGDRIYPVHLPQSGARSAILYSRYATEFTGDDLDGDEGPDEALFRLECWADGPDGYNDATTLAQAVIVALRSAGGALAASGQTASWLRVTNWYDEAYYPDDGGDADAHCSVVDVAINYDPALAAS